MHAGLPVRCDLCTRGRAMKEEGAVEKGLSLITSIGIMRRQIQMQEIKEIKPEEVQDYLIRDLSQ